MRRPVRRLEVRKPTVDSLEERSLAGSLLDVAALAVLTGTGTLPEFAVPPAAAAEPRYVAVPADDGEPADPPVAIDEGTDAPRPATSKYAVPEGIIAPFLADDWSAGERWMSSVGPSVPAWDEFALGAQHVEPPDETPPLTRTGYGESQPTPLAMSGDTSLPFAIKYGPFVKGEAPVASSYGGSTGGSSTRYVTADLAEVKYSGDTFITIEADPGTEAYPTGKPHWLDNNANGLIEPQNGDHALPVGFVRNSYVTVEAKFKVTKGDVQVPPGTEKYMTTISSHASGLNFPVVARRAA